MIEENWDELFSRITTEDWNDIKKHQNKWSRETLSEKLWYHSRYYEVNPKEPFDYDKPQKIYGREETDIPNNPKLFFPSLNGRFALENKPVSYWAFDFYISKTEITKELHKEEGCSLEEMMKYVKKDAMWALTEKYLKFDAPILDLRHTNNAFFRLIKKYNIYNSEEIFFKDKIYTKNDSVYPLTQIIAKHAFKNNFQGIVWTSVRDPNDCNYGGAICMVIFNQDILMIERDTIPPTIGKSRFQSQYS